MAWQQGPLPPNTYGWGGVSPTDMKTGFLFADFQGDHVITPEGGRIEPKDIAWFDNSLTLPPNTEKKGS